MPYAPNTTREGVDVQKVYATLEAAKSDPIQILQFLEWCSLAENATIASGAIQHKKNMIEAQDNVTTLHAYRYLWRAANYIADHDLLHRRQQ